MISDDRILEALKIKERLALFGLTLSDVDRLYTLAPSTARVTLVQPNKAGENAISAALGMPASDLWPSRYHKTGQRRSQLDYSRPPTLAQRRKAAGAQT